MGTIHYKRLQLMHSEVTRLQAEVTGAHPDCGEAGDLGEGHGERLLWVPHLLQQLRGGCPEPRHHHLVHLSQRL